METKYIVNNATGQTITGNITINGGLTITGDTSIRPYKVYTALLTQSGTSDPTIVVLENNIGNIVWERDDVGRYSATLINAFTTNKTFINLSNNFSFTGSNFQTSWVNSSIFSEDSFQIRTIQNGSPTDNMLFNTPIEIRVYN